MPEKEAGRTETTRAETRSDCTAGTETRADTATAAPTTAENRTQETALPCVGER